MVSGAWGEDRESGGRREEAVRRQHTAVLDGPARLPVSGRTARFRDPDGTTRTEVYWGVPADRLRLGEAGAPASSLIAVSAAQYDDEHRLLQRTRGRYPVEVQTGTDTRMIVPSPLTLEGATGRYHLGLQWGQYQLWASDSPSEGKRMGPKRRVATARVDSLEPLRAEGPGVEMSDVKVLTLPDTSAQSLARPTEQATPYPFRTLTGDTPLLLSFELYHLAYGADDRTRYSIAYEAKRETKRGWTKNCSGNDTQTTRTEMTKPITDRVTKEASILEMAELHPDQPQEEVVKDLILIHTIRSRTKVK